MNNSQKYNNKEKIVIYLISSLVGIIITFVAMLLSSLIMVLFEISLSLLPIMASVCLLIGSFIAGLISARKIGSGGIVCGLMVSTIIFLFVFLVSLVCDPTGISFNTLIHFIINLLSSLIGAIIGVNKSTKFV